MKIKFWNPDHETTAYVLVKPEGIITQRQLDTARRNTCGCAGCKCEVLPVGHYLVENGEGAYFVEVAT